MKALKQLKAGKYTRIDNVSAEVLKVDNGNYCRAAGLVMKRSGKLRVYQAIGKKEGL